MSNYEPSVVDAIIEYLRASADQNDSLDLQAADLIEGMQARISELEQDTARIRKDAIDDCAELLSRQHAWLTNVAAATLVLNIDNSINKAEAA